ncbi:MAG: Crp/Fnr family transcriptional regulator [Bacteroidota bacterium]
MVELLSLYNFIPSEHKQWFKSKTSLNTIKKGEFLLLDEEVQHQLFLVKQGILMMYFDTDEKMQVIDFAYQNRFCVDIDSFSSQEPSKFCIQAMNDCEVECISYEDLQHIFDQSPEIERAYRLLTERVLAAVLKKHLNRQILNIQQRFFQVMEKQPELFKLVPHKYLASYIGIDPTNFSKLFKKHCTDNKLMFE